MSRKFGPLIVSFALCLCGLTVHAQNSAEKQSETFTFLDISDTHQTANGDIAPLRKLAEDAARMNPKPAFIIDTGDITEAGRPEEYARFREAIAHLTSAGIGFYATPGNHDVRWSPDGKEGFARVFGKLYQSFDYDGMHFVLLDSTVSLEHWGHFDKAELDWLTKDLKRIKPETPVFLFMHHPIGRDKPSTRFIDNENDLNPVLHGHNVVAMFTGHGHQDLAWQTSGVTTVMPRGLYQGSYYRVQVSPILVTLDRVVKEQPALIHVASIPIVRKSRPSLLRVGWDDPDVPFLERRRIAATLTPRAITDNADTEKAEYRLDDEAYVPMKKDARDIWRGEFPTRDISIGIHTADVRVTTSNGVALEDELIFEVERNLDEPTRKWAINLDGPIQSSPLLGKGVVYVSSLDGHTYALDTEKGKHLWSFPTKGQFLASPILVGGSLFIGGTDHYLYALDAANGHQHWKYDTGSPLFATASVAQGIVCVGGNGRIYGIDANSGVMRWTQPAGSFFQSAAATDGTTFYLGGWDNTLYALDARTGTPRWTVKMGSSFYFSPAIAAPTVVKGRVYVASNDGVLHCVDAQNGHDQWAVHAPAGGDSFGYSSPTVDAGRVYIGGLGEQGNVYALNADTGDLVWQAKTGQIIYDSSPRLAPDGGSLAIMGVRGKVSVLDSTHGNLLWKYELGPGNIFSTPAYDGKVVYTTTMANDVQALNGPGVAGSPLLPVKPKAH